MSLTPSLDEHASPSLAPDANPGLRVVLFGATGMVGQGVLRECLHDREVAQVLVIGRSPCGIGHPRLREILHDDFFDFTALAPQLEGFDACFFCLGVSSIGMAEDAYRRTTYDITLAAATLLARLNPQMTFVYVSGTHTDSTERGGVMWARVKGATENALLRLPFRAAYMFRPGAIQPLHGIRSRTAWVHALYTLTGPLFGLARRLLPRQILTTEQVGRAMLAVVRRQPPGRILEPPDIAALG
jgi:uncharacterized protein YbjT (DUF2867 family)